MRPRLIIASIATAGLLAAGGLATTAQGAPDRTPNMGDPFVRGQATINRAGDRLPEIAARYDMSPGELRQRLLNDETLGMDLGQRLAYFDLAAPDEIEHADADHAHTAADVLAGADPFSLSSLPGAEKTIYLDFDGHVTTGTTWNSQYNRTSIDSPTYSKDGDHSAFSAEELDIIARSWAVVAEDFAPWNVNVTTIDPGPEALRRSGSSDTEWGVRVLITDDWRGCGCGGFAYLGSFDDVTDEPVYVFNTGFSGVSEAISHEVGHAMLLHHDGLVEGNTHYEYYEGHDTSGTPGWAPIMGASYWEPVTHWSKQEYPGATNTGENDTTIIGSTTNGNNFGLKADDHGDTAGSATPLINPQVDQSGIITTRNDIDMFTFITNGGAVQFNANNAAIMPNLDIELTLRDANGNVVARDNIANGLDATIATTLGAGTYTIAIDGVGVGNPAANPPSGYSDYGSLGAYTLTGSINGLGEPDTTAPAAPVGLTATESDGTVNLSWTANGEEDLAGYTIARTNAIGTPFAAIGSVDANTTSFADASAPVGENHYVVTASDTTGNESAQSNIASAVVPQPPVDLSTSPISGALLTGTVAGTFDATIDRGGATQTITESDSSGKPQRRHDRAEFHWTVPASAGNQTLTVVASASGGGDADTGFAVEYSRDGSTWIPFAVVNNGAGIDVTEAIGAPSGNVFVRVIDTDRSAGNRSHNSVTVDFIEINGDGAVVQPPTASMTVASLATSTQNAGRGQQYGVATVTVTDDLGSALAGANVSVVMSGSFSETLNGVTGADGRVTLVTTASAKRPMVEACVQSVTGTSLPYDAGTESC